MRILVSGSSGLIGSTLIPYLKEKHHEVYKLVRVKADMERDEIAWNSEQGVINPLLIEGFDVVIHLAGEGLMGLWTKEKKEKIRDSRVIGTQRLCHDLCHLKEPPFVFICASAIAYYGDRGAEICTEETSKGSGFLSDVCDAWEIATHPASQKGIRTINLRFGMVLSPKGGTLKVMLPIFKMGLGGVLGDGNQYMSWIAIDDLIRVVDFVINEEKISGSVNTVSTQPVTNREFTKTLGHVLNRPTFFSVPKFGLELMPGEMGHEFLLTSIRVLPKKLKDAGFEFQFPILEEALRHLIMKT